jgi:hypothetical protein
VRKPSWHHWLGWACERLLRKPIDIKLSSVVDLEPGANQILDVICDGIVAGRPFVI